jgi:hypothetical protein
VSNPVSGFITVEFEAECIVYLKGEIIPGCRVVKTDRYNNLLCDTNNAGIYIESNQKNASIADGQIISIVVDVVVYDVLQEKMSISGSLFVPTPLLIAYEIQPKADKDYIPAITTLLAQLDDISAISGTSNWKSFAALIYPHKNKSEIKPGVKNMLDIIKEDISPIANATNTTPVAKYIIRDSKLDLTTPNVYYAENPPDDSTVITLPIDSVWIALIENYRNYTNLIKGMIHAYGNAEVLQKHKNLWVLYGLNRV